MSSSMMGIVQPRETDVLCARGGAALRHAGNQDYQRLIQANKQRYSTCLKNEKHNISRSIVAAIIGKNGRFLGRDAKKEGVWFDIGHKKAVEKTSQALRDCKLEEQPANGLLAYVPIYNASGLSGANHSVNGSAHSKRTDSAMSFSSKGSLGSTSFADDSYTEMFFPQWQQREQQEMGRNATGQLRNNMTPMPAPPSWTASVPTMEPVAMPMPITEVPRMISSRPNLPRQYNTNSSNLEDQRPSVPSLNLVEPKPIQRITSSMSSIDMDFSNHSPEQKDLIDCKGYESPGSMMSCFSKLSIGYESRRMISSRPNLPRQYNTNSSCGSRNSNSINCTRQSITSNSSRNNNNLSNFDNCNGVAVSEQPLIQQQPLQQQQLQQSQQEKFGRDRDYTQCGLNDNNFNNFEDQRPAMPSLNEVERKPIQRIRSSMSSIDLDCSKHFLDNKEYESPGSMMSSLSKLSIGYESRRSSLMSGFSKLSGYSSDINNTVSNMAKKFNAINYYALSSQPESLRTEEFGIDDQQLFADIPKQQD